MDVEIELEISPGTVPGEYAVRVVRAPAGGHPSGMFDLDVDAILNRLGDLESTVLASAAVARRQTPVAERPVRQIGEQLFHALFSREVYGAYRASLGAAQQSGGQLRLVLRLAAPQLASLPWEMLFDPGTEAYLCQTEPLLRHVPAADYYSNPLQVVPPLRILGVIASPRGLPTLDVETEKEHLARALAGPLQAGRIELSWAPKATWDEVHEQLLAGPWHVLHFIGHGDYDTDTDEGQITLVRQDGRADSIEASRFVDLLSTARPVPRLVVLNSCYSGRSGGQDLFSGTAAALARSGISAVAAMQFTVSDTGAIAFAHGFYAALANGRSVDEAARNGRISMRGTSGGTLEWVTPVLYVRGNSTELFALTSPPSGRQSPSPTPADPEEPPTEPVAAPARDAQIHEALYLRASRELKSKNYILSIRLLDELLSRDPDHPGASFLRETARNRYTAERKYLQAREAENERDWATAAAGFSLLASDPSFPDAAARKTRCETMQREAAREQSRHIPAETRDRKPVRVITAPLPIVTPQSDAPTTRATITNAKEDPTVPPAVPPPEPGRVPGSPQKRPASKAQANRRPADVTQTPLIDPSPINTTMFLIGGLVLLSAGFLAPWILSGSNSRGASVGIFRTILLLIVPAGYTLIIVAGLPNRTSWSPKLLIPAVLSAAVGADTFLSGGFMAVPLSLVALALVIAASIKTNRTPNKHRHLSWIFLAVLAVHPLAAMLSGGGFLLAYPTVVIGFGAVVVVVAARRMKPGERP